MISIVIPTYNEVDNIGKLLNYLKANSNPNNITEIIVVEGNECKSTENIAVNNGAKVLYSTKGRAIQMNVGGKLSKGKILYFLHADSFPPASFDELILESVKTYKSGCFQMKFDSKHPLLNFFGWLTKFNNNLCRGGDQSLYVDAELFDKIGGFNEDILFMEDNEIIPRLRRESNFAVIKKTLVTSARRHRANGTVRLQWIFATIHAGYRLGIPQEKLLNYYNRKVK